MFDNQVTCAIGDSESCNLSLKHGGATGTEICSSVSIHTSRFAYTVARESDWDPNKDRPGGLKPVESVVNPPCQRSASE